VLLTKYIYFGINESTTPMKELFELITTSCVHASVKVSVTGMFLDWVPDGDDEEMVNGEILPGLVSETTPLPAGTCFEFPYGTNLYIIFYNLLTLTINTPAPSC